MINKDKTHYLYTALFCEENIWHLAQKLNEQGIKTKNMTVLLLSNSAQQIVVLNQLSSPVGEAVIWDYHVIFQVEEDKQSWIYDFDSRLDFPILKKSYFRASFPPSQSLQKDYQMIIRYIPASDYLRRFSSDRSHMINVISPHQFPTDPPILATVIDKPITLSEYCNMSLNLEDNSKVENSSIYTLECQ